MASQDWLDKDFYAILGVPQDADDAAIKKAYRKLARKYHPDQNPGNKAAEDKFKEIGEAHQVLSDPEQRQQYDAIRQMTRGGARFTAGGPGGGAGGFEDVFSSMFGGGGGGTRVRFGRGGPGGPGGQGGPQPGGSPNFEDILSGLFQQGGAYSGGYGGGYGEQGYGYGDSGYGYGAPPGPRRGQDVEARTTIPFRDAVMGSVVHLMTPTGERVTTRIPAGVKDGQKIKIKGKGHVGDQGAPQGDLFLIVTVEPDPVFGRDGDNLTVDLPVTFAEAALGATVEVPTIDGQRVKVKIAPGTPSGRTLRLKGRGVQRKDRPGALLAKVNIVVPQRLSDAAREAVEKLQTEESGFDPRAELFAKVAATTKA